MALFVFAIIPINVRYCRLHCGAVNYLQHLIHSTSNKCKQPIFPHIGNVELGTAKQHRLEVLHFISFSFANTACVCVTLRLRGKQTLISTCEISGDNRAICVPIISIFKVHRTEDRMRFTNLIVHWCLELSSPIACLLDWPWKYEFLKFAHW